MMFGIAEAKEFCENHEDKRVQALWRMLCEARSKNAQWCDALNKANEQIAELRLELSWMKENRRDEHEREWPCD